MRRKIFAALLAASALLASPPQAGALVFSEVMYDPDGSDSGREWVEVYNDGAESIDLATVSVVEGNTRHRVVGYGGGATSLGSGRYAVIADKPDLFLADYPGVSAVLDSAFSLANDGETLRLSSDAGSPDLDSVSWPSGAGATGGRSWQRSGDAWIAAAATPGGPNADAEPIATSTAATGAAEPAAAEAPALSAHAEPVGVTTYEVPPSLAVSAGRPRVTLARVPVAIEPAASAGGRISFRWSWGDGASSRGARGVHSYRYPGTYAVVLYAVSGRAVAVSRTSVTVEEPRVSLAASARGYVELRNAGAGEVNLGGLSLEASRAFTFPEDTLALPGAALRLPVDELGFSLAPGEAVALRYPDGGVVATTTAVD